MSTAEPQVETRQDRAQYGVCGFLAVVGVLVITGERVLPDELRTATIHRLELPQGWFERRVELPAGRYDGVSSTTANGCPG